MEFVRSLPYQNYSSIDLLDFWLKVPGPVTRTVTRGLGAAVVSPCGHESVVGVSDLSGAIPSMIGHHHDGIPVAQQGDIIAYCDTLSCHCRYAGLCRSPFSLLLPAARCLSRSSFTEAKGTHLVAQSDRLQSQSLVADPIDQ